MSDEQTTDPSSNDQVAPLEARLLRALPIIFLIFMLLIISVGVLFADAARSPEIIAAVVKVPNNSAEQNGTASEAAGWKVTGRVLKGVQPMEAALVWCVGYDSSGNAFTPPAQRTNANGEFAIDFIPETLAGGGGGKGDQSYRRGR